RMAWRIKQQNPQAIYDEMTAMAGKMQAKRQRQA
ncbi:MAG: short chain dehydrogenase, partial [Pseudomonas aeruginosa]|nr:short chain dehydrogenase [Pseudomonas aeruginosa]